MRPTDRLVPRGFRGRVGGVRGATRRRKRPRFPPPIFLLAPRRRNARALATQRTRTCNEWRPPLICKRSRSFQLPPLLDLGCIVSSPTLLAVWCRNRDAMFKSKKKKTIGNFFVFVFCRQRRGCGTSKAIKHRLLSRSGANVEDKMENPMLDCDDSRVSLQSRLL